MTLKKSLGKRIAQNIKPGQILGLGSGTTVEAALRALDTRNVSFAPTSFEIANIAAQLGHNVIHPSACNKLDWAFDGADEVDPEGNLLKGKGGAMLQEKIVASCADHLKILVTKEKLVKKLGNMPVPVEIIPGALNFVTRELEALGASKVTTRVAGSAYGPYWSEQGNIVLDAKFNSLSKEFANEISLLPGVVEHGLFYDFKVELHVATEEDVQVTQFR